MASNLPEGFEDPADETEDDFTDDEYLLAELPYSEYYKRQFPNHLDTEDQKLEQD